METHKNKQTRRTATKIFHIGHNIISSGVADLELLFTQGFADLERAWCVRELKTKTVPFEYPRFPASVHRKIIACSELDQSKRREIGHRNLLFIAALLLIRTSARRKQAT